MAAAVVGALLIAGLSTFGDFVWARWIPGHRPIYGLAHGTVFCLGIGACLGVLARRPAAGAAGGAAIGFGAAGGYYLLAPLAGMAAMFVLWVALWVLLGLLHGALQRTGGTPRAALVRGVLAAAGSGLAFYAISDIWLAPDPAGPNYAWHYAAWTAALLPGFLALLVPAFSARR